VKVCDLVQAYTASSGGIRTYVDTKRRYLLANTDGRHVLVIPGEKDSVIRNRRSTVYMIAAPKVPGCDPYRMILRADKVERILRDEVPDVIEVGSPYVMPAAALRHRSRTLCTVVGFFHTDFAHAYVEPFLRHRFGAAAARAGTAMAVQMTRRIYSRCDATVTSSLRSWRTLRALGVPSVWLVPLGVDPQVFHPGRRSADLRARLGVPEGGILLSYTGRFDEEKRVRVLVEAFRLIRRRVSAVFVMAGDGPLRPEIERLAADIDGLRVLPYERDRNALASLLASSDLYLAAGPFETFGLSILEAQSCGLPVVGVQAGALLERVPESLGILGPVDDHEAMARNVELLLAGPFRAMGQAARQRVDREYSWDSTFRKVLDLYATLHAKTAAAQLAGGGRAASAGRFWFQGRRLATQSVGAPAFSGGQSGLRHG
jgi:alpha-1,6-mannosyltransferase